MHTATMNTASKKVDSIRAISSRHDHMSEMYKPSWCNNGNGLTDFLELSYSELTERNLKIKADKKAGKNREEFEKEMVEILKNEKGIKAVVVAFCDLEGKLHLLDYDKLFLLGSLDNLTFDGSSIAGFSTQDKSDLRLKLDFSSFKWLPSDIFGPGKVLVFSNVIDQDGKAFASDFRVQLQLMTDKLMTEKGITVNAAPEIEGFLFDGLNAEQNFNEEEGFTLVTEGGYFNTLPQDKLRLFIDKVAEVQRAMGFENEKDHPEVAPSQFEINFKYCDILTSCDNIMLYKLTARQVAATMGYTASFLPKPVQGINGTGMHSNMSLEQKGKNIFHEPAGEMGLSEIANKFLTGILYHAREIALSFCSSVNGFRRLDPAFEAPNEIKVSPTDRGSMIRIPLGNEKSARIEVRSVAPDTNPYFAYYLILSAGFESSMGDSSTYEKIKSELKLRGKQILPSDIYEAIDEFESSKFVEETLGKVNKAKYLNLKKMVADRSPKALGKKIKNAEVRYHHEVRNQMIWNDF